MSLLLIEHLTHLLIFFTAIFLVRERQYSLSFFNGQLISAWVLNDLDREVELAHLVFGARASNPEEVE
jgi:hypothetical protein